ncbi:MAG: cytochrome P450 [Chloroflexota bacterium]
MFNYTLKLIADEDPYPTYKWMRDNEPAHYSESENIWVLTRFKDVSDSFKNWKVWSSMRRGNLVNDMPERVGKTLGTSDPPSHSFARGLVNKAFTPRTVAELMPRIRSLAQRLSAQAREKGTLEFVADISAPFNAAILGTMFGVPDADFINLRHWLDDFFLREPVKEGETPRQVVAMGKLREYLNALVMERQSTQANQADDLMTAMLLAEEDGKRLSQEQVVITTMTFLTAGFESTNNLFTNLTNALACHPQMFAQLKQQPNLVPAFVEEGMRWDSAAQGFVRSPNQDITLHDKVIPEGSQVLLHIGSANRDEREFENADAFDLTRDNKRHVGLGQGVHFCVGAPLAREMTHTIFEEMLAASDVWEANLSSATRVLTPNFRGFARLPLTIHNG